MPDTPAGGRELPDPVPALTARLDELEQLARAAARDGGGADWFHTGHSYDVHTEPFGQPVAVGPYGCGMFYAGEHIAAQDPRAVMTLCWALRILLRDYERATATATAANTPEARAAALGDWVAGSTSGYAAGIHHALTALLAGLTPPAHTPDGGAVSQPPHRS